MKRGLPAGGEERTGRSSPWDNGAVNVLFDLDGTLTDPRAGIVGSLRYALRELGRPSPPDADLVRYIGPPLRETFASLLGSDCREAIDEAVALYRERLSAIGIFENAVYPGVPSMLAELQALGMTLYVATAKLQSFAERIVEYFGLTSFFHRVFGSELDGARAIKGDLIAYLLRRESLSPGGTVMVGDRAHDVLGAVANGVVAIGVRWGYGSREELEAAGATVLCEAPAMLAPLLGAHAVRAHAGSQNPRSTPPSRRSQATRPAQTSR
jgi:phosphoglycolate phosphatase